MLLLLFLMAALLSLFMQWAGAADVVDCILRQGLQGMLYGFSDSFHNVCSKPSPSPSTSTFRGGLTFHDSPYIRMGIHSCAGGFQRLGERGQHSRINSTSEWGPLRVLEEASTNWSASPMLPHNMLACRDEAKGVTAVRYGPLTISPGEWLHIEANNLQLQLQRSGLLRVGDRILEYVGHGVIPKARDGSSGAAESIGLPPLYLHHVVVTTKYINTFFVTTGDNLAGDPAGGGNTYVRATPPGYCLVVDKEAQDSLEISAILVDHRRTGPQMTFFLEVAFRLANESCTPLSFVALTNPIGRVVKDQHSRVRRPCPEKGAKCDAATILANLYYRFLVGPGSSIVWFRVPMPVSGRLLPGAWVHTHRARYSQMLLLRDQAVPPTCNNLDGPFKYFFDGYRAKDKHALELAQQAFERSYNGVVCRTDPSVADFVVDANGSHWERAGKLACESNLHLKEGELLTVVLSFEPRWAGNVEFYPMHFAAFLFLEVDGGSAVQTESKGQWGRCEGGGTKGEVEGEVEGEASMLPGARSAALPAPDTESLAGPGGDQYYANGDPVISSHDIEELFLQLNRPADGALRQEQPRRHCADGPAAM